MRHLALAGGKKRPTCDHCRRNGASLFGHLVSSRYESPFQTLVLVGFRYGNYGVGFLSIANMPA